MEQKLLVSERIETNSYCVSEELQECPGDTYQSCTAVRDVYKSCTSAKDFSQSGVSCTSVKDICHKACSCEMFATRLPNHIKFFFNCRDV